jgi:hypothetical protein
VNDIKETVIEHIYGDSWWGISTSEWTWRNKILKLKDKFPDSVQIVADNEDGSLYAKIPFKLVKISKPRQVQMTDEQRAASVERLKKAREMRGTKT